MATSALSVLTGGAGTGKTTALRALCHSPQILGGGILVLAPTGKANMVLSSALSQDGIKHDARTVFAFLNARKRCDPFTYRYYLSNIAPAKDIPATVIIDESSMLTEEMMAALLEALAHAKRIIFAGDPNQLPPIGSGKPFFELCKKLEEEPGQPHFSCLVQKNRNRGLASEIGDFFKADGKNLDAEEIAAISSQNNENFRLVHCEKPEDLEDNLVSALNEVFDDLELSGPELIRFDQSLGGEICDKWMNFNEPQASDNWQILSPWKNNDTYGSQRINNFIHEKYAISEERGEGIRKRKTKQELGNELILYGEKVINLQNRAWKPELIFSPQDPAKTSCMCFTANGETGMVASLSGKKWNPEKKMETNTHHGIQFAGQPGYHYKYRSTHSEEADSKLELAYALTIHKTQGSGFGRTILVLMDDSTGASPFLSREMLYTALTRQREKLIVITNRSLQELFKYSASSDLERRLTNLFGQNIREHPGGGWYDERLVHRAKDGEMLRSKSELVIYNELLNAGLNPLYEQDLEWEDGRARPDFTFESADGPIYWEHLGMLGNDGYRAHWEKKRALYARHGISEENGNLFISSDGIATGSLDATQIVRLIEQLKKRLVG